MYTDTFTDHKNTVRRSHYETETETETETERGVSVSVIGRLQQAEAEPVT